MESGKYEVDFYESQEHADILAQLVSRREREALFCGHHVERTQFRSQQIVAEELDAIHMYQTYVNSPELKREFVANVMNKLFLAEGNVKFAKLLLHLLYEGENDKEISFDSSIDTSC